MQKNRISFQIKNDKVIPELVSGSSTYAVAVIKQGNPLFNKLPTARVEDAETSSAIAWFNNDKRQERRRSPSASRTRFFGDDGLCVYNGKGVGSKIRSQVQDDLILFKTTAQGFTLIELLVVVLIIGILAAVALPQYQKAVFKTRFSEYETNLKTLGQAATICKIAKGTDCSIEELDIEIPTCNPLPQWTNCSYQTINNGINLVASAPGYPNNNPILSYYFTNETFTDGRPEIPVSATVMGITCRNSTLSVEECKTLGFTEYVIYNLYKRP